MDSGDGTRKGRREKKGRGAGRRSQNRSGKRGKDWLTPKKSGKIKEKQEEKPRNFLNVDTKCPHWRMQRN
jgi:hypothetical protein